MRRIASIVCICLPFLGKVTPARAELTAELASAGGPRGVAMLIEYSALLVSEFI